MSLPVTILVLIFVVITTVKVFKETRDKKAMSICALIMLAYVGAFLVMFNMGITSSSPMVKLREYNSLSKIGIVIYESCFWGANWIFTYANLSASFNAGKLRDRYLPIFGWAVGLLIPVEVIILITTHNLGWISFGLGMVALVNGISYFVALARIWRLFRTQRTIT